MTEPIHVISLGAGVQSSTVALMAAAGLIAPMPDCAIFADTGAEPKHVYAQLDYLRGKLPFPIHVVSGGNLYEDLMSGSKRASWGRPPFFVINDDQKPGQLNRQCTGDYKLDPIRRKVRELVGLTRKKSPPYPVVVQWIGISVDEVTRAKQSTEPWQANRFPLLDLGMTRDLCVKWLEVNGHPIPKKSACSFCPYRDDGGWLEMKVNDPDSFAKGCEVDAKIRNEMPGVSKSNAFVHRSLTPLVQIDFPKRIAESNERAEEAKQRREGKNAWRDDGQINLFINECAGICGV